MTKKWSILATGAFVAIAAAGATHWVRESSEPSSPRTTGMQRTGPTSDDLKTIRDRVAALEIDRVRRESSAVPAQIAATIEQTSEVPPRKSEAVDNELAEFERSSRHRARLNERIRIEGRDPTWAPHLEQTVMAALETDQFTETTTVDVTCATTVCRIEVRHDNLAAQHQFHQQLAGTEAGREGAGTWCLQTEEEGIAQTFCYIAREGYPELLNDDQRYGVDDSR